jgi:hypothetical protein
MLFLFYRVWTRLKNTSSIEADGAYHKRNDVTYEHDQEDQSKNEYKAIAVHKRG